MFAGVGAGGGAGAGGAGLQPRHNQSEDIQDIQDTPALDDPRMNDCKGSVQYARRRLRQWCWLLVGRLRQRPGLHNLPCSIVAIVPDVLVPTPGHMTSSKSFNLPLFLEAFQDRELHSSE